MSIDEKRIELDDEMISQMRNTKEKSFERRKEATRQQMVKLITRLGIATSQVKPMKLGFLKPPSQLGPAYRLHCRSKYHRRSPISLLVHDGFVDYFADETKAKNSIANCGSNRGGIDLRRVVVHFDVTNITITLQGEGREWVFGFDMISEWQAWLNLIHFASHFARGMTAVCI